MDSVGHRKNGEDPMKNILMGAAAVALLTACGQNGGGDVSSVVENAGAPAVRSAERALKDLGDVVLRTGDANEANAVLEAMMLHESGAGRVTFASKTVDGAGAVFEGASVALPEAGDDGGTVSFGTVTFEGLDMTEAGPSFARLRLEDIEVAPNDPEEAEQGTFTIASFDVANPSPELAGWFASLLGAGSPSAFPGAEAIRLDRMTMDDLNVDIDTGQEKMKAKIDGLELAGFGDDALAVAILSGLSFDVEEDGEPFSMTLDALSITGADLAVFSAMMENIGDEEAMAEAIFSTAYNNPIDPGYNTFVVNGLNLNAQGVSLALPSLDSSVQRNGTGDPTRFVTKPYTLTLDADPEGGDLGSQLGGALGMVGYERLELSGEQASDYNPDEDIATFSASNNHVTLKDGFSLRFGGKIGGYKAYGAALSNMALEDMVEGDPDNEAMMQAISALTLHDLELTLTDDSLVDRLFNLAAAQSGEDPAQMRQQAVAMVSMAPMMAAESGVDMDMLTQVTAAVSEFLQEPGTLTIKLDPAAPLTAATFQGLEDPSAINGELLGLSVTHAK